MIMRRKCYYILPLLAMSLAASSCNDFLTSKDKDKMIPKNAAHFEELIYGEMINPGDDFTSITDVMADGISMEAIVGGSAERRSRSHSYYTWQQTPEYDLEHELFSDAVFPGLYADVLLCNAIESLLPEVTDDLKLVDRLFGEIYFLRAHRYLLLANLYGTPYVSEALSHTTSCVPLNELVGVDDVQLPRATQRAIYDKIERDIENAIKHFESAGYPETIYRPGLRAAHVLATRIYLMEKKYDRVIEHANALEGEYAKLCDLNLLDALNGGAQINDITGESTKKAFFYLANTEILYTFGSYSIDPFAGSLTSAPTHRLTPKGGILALYEAGDLRSKLFFDFYNQPSKVRKLDQTIAGNCFRLSEALMNRAEAYVMTEQKQKGFADMQTLRTFRFKDRTAPALPTTGDPMKVLQDERMREFCFEGMRWFDLRRWGSPEIRHRYIDTQGQHFEYVLEANDVAYTLPLPVEEIQYNPVIDNIQRPVRIGTAVSQN